MKSETVVIAIFSGPGTTLRVARALAEELRRLGKTVSLASMDRPERFAPPAHAAIGLAVPLACFSTYPTAWRFIDSLPEGEGREAFFLATMGGLALGMEGPIRRVLGRKRYVPIGAKIVSMPSNYANKEIPVEKNRKLAEIAAGAMKKYARDLVEGKGSWGGGGFLASFFARLAHTKMPWRTFYKIFPLAVDPEKCIGCGLCRDLCPEKNILLEDAKAKIGDHCQSCQRCVAFCPVNAIIVPGKPAERYCGIELEELRSLAE